MKKNRFQLLSILVFITLIWAGTTWAFDGRHHDRHPRNHPGTKHGQMYDRSDRHHYRQHDHFDHGWHGWGERNRFERPHHGRHPAPYYPEYRPYRHDHFRHHNRFYGTWAEPGGYFSLSIGN